MRAAIACAGIARVPGGSDDLPAVACSHGYQSVSLLTVRRPTGIAARARTELGEQRSEPLLVGSPASD